MPVEKTQGLQKLQFRPGVNRESTTLANEGGWFESDKVRWRSGYPEKIGGWVKDTGVTASTLPPPSNSSFWGVCRSLFNWLNLAGYNLLGAGTNLKFYIQNGKGGDFYDVTPIRSTTAAGDVTFKATTGSTTITCTDPGHGAQTGDFVTFSGAAGLGGDITADILNAEFQVTYVDSSQYTITTSVAATSGDTGTGGTATVAAYQISTGSDIYTTGVGWGAGGWGGTTTVSGTSTLSSSLSSSATTINVTSAASFAASGTVWINEEAITYAGKTTTTLTGCTRGTSGTTAAAHASGISVYQYPADATGWGVAAPEGLGLPIQLRLWSQSNFGEDLIFNPRGGSMYYWAVNGDPNTFDRGQVIYPGATVTVRSTPVVVEATCPAAVNTVMVSDASRFVIALGCNPLNSAGTGIDAALDPLLVRWSDQESFNIWTPQTTNQAGDYRLSSGSQIITAQQTRQEILVWTDAALYSMQYLGPPYVWGFQIVGSNISIMGPNAVATANNVTYWMGSDKFYMYSGRVETLPCTLRQYVFDDINLDQSAQIFAGTNEGYNEVWWFYCSANSTIVNKYVVYNHLEHTWYYGTLERTAWLDSPIRSNPMAAGYGFAQFTGSVSGNTLTVTNIVAGKLQIGTMIAVSGLPENTYITALGTGTGANGTYTLNNLGTVASTAMVGIPPQAAGNLIYHESGVDDGTTNPVSPIVSYCQSSDFDIGDGHNFGFVWRIIPDVTFDGSTSGQPAVTFTVRPRQNPGANYGSTDTPSVQSAQTYGNGVQTYNVQQFTQYAYVRIRGRQMAFRVGSTDLGVMWQLGAPRLDVRPDGRR